MAGRVIAFSVVALISMVFGPLQAPCATLPGTGSTAALNRQLTSIAQFGVPTNVVLANPATLPAARPSAAQTHVFSSQTRATFRMFAASFAAARRILDYRAAGFDANLWGELAPSRTVKMSYSVRF